MFDSMPLVCVCVKVSTTLIKLTMVELPGLVMELCLACGSIVYVCVHACMCICACAQGGVCQFNLLSTRGTEYEFEC